MYTHLSLVHTHLSLVHTHLSLMHTHLSRAHTSELAERGRATVESRSWTLHLRGLEPMTLVPASSSRQFWACPKP